MSRCCLNSVATLRKPYLIINRLLRRRLALPTIEQRRPDLSIFLVHLTKGEGQSDEEKSTDARNRLFCILTPDENGICTLIGHEYGLFAPAAEGNDSLKELIQSVSFTETPLEHLELFSNQYSKFGIVFKKDFIMKNGGNPIFNISTLYGNELKKAALDLIRIENYDTRDIASLLPFFNIFGIDASGRTIDFYWEREWRVPKQLQFHHEDVFVGLCENETDVVRLTATFPEIPFIRIDWSIDKKMSYLRDWKSPRDRKVIIENVCPYGAVDICPIF